MKKKQWMPLEVDIKVRLACPFFVFLLRPAKPRLSSNNSTKIPPPNPPKSPSLPSHHTPDNAPKIRQLPSLPKPTRRKRRSRSIIRLADTRLRLRRLYSRARLDLVERGFRFMDGLVVVMRVRLVGLRSSGLKSIQKSDSTRRVFCSHRLEPRRRQSGIGCCVE
jgi:hypothetical protein